MKNKLRRGCAILLILTAALCLFTGAAAEKRIGIAWLKDTDTEHYRYFTDMLDEMRIPYVLLDRVRPETIPDGGECTAKEGYLLPETAERVKSCALAESNVYEVLDGIDGVIFTGGSDVSPTLYRVPEPWHGIEKEIDYDAARDVSDYLLMRCCIENDIPVIGICRGMQMLGVVSGATVVQDIPTWLKENGIDGAHAHRGIMHESDGGSGYACHDVEIVDRDSILYDIVGGPVLQNVPSWHHQCLYGVEGTALKVTGITRVDGVELIEAIERTDRTFIAGFQFHPEAAAAFWRAGAKNAAAFMPKTQADAFFARFWEAVNS